MAFNARVTLQSKWALLVKFGATKTCIFQEKPASVADPLTGKVTAPPISTHELEVVFDKISASLVDGSTIQVIDRFALFPSLDLPVIPKINDIIVDPSLREWIVKSTDTDPVDAHWQLRVRPIR